MKSLSAAFGTLLTVAATVMPHLVRLDSRESRMLPHLVRFLRVRVPTRTSRRRAIQKRLDAVGGPFTANTQELLSTRHK